MQNDVDLMEDFDNSPGVSKLAALKNSAKTALQRYSLPPPSPVNGPKYITANELDQKYGHILTR